MNVVVCREDIQNIVFGDVWKCLLLITLNIVIEILILVKYNKKASCEYNLSI